jgi:hypothetical protein
MLFGSDWSLQDFELFWHPEASAQWSPAGKLVVPLQTPSGGEHPAPEDQPTHG